MSNILLEEHQVLMHIKDTIHNIKISPVMIDAKYHHNTNYKKAVSLCEHGILTIKDLQRKKIRNYTDEFVEKMGDIESHINGNNAVSLAVIGLKDLYHNEYEYDPFNPTQIDFLVSSDVKAGRSSLHYGNEFLSYGSISPDKLKSVDIRLLKLIELIEKNDAPNDTIIDAVEKFNILKDIAIAIKEYHTDIPLREMSYDNNFSIDIDKLSNISKIILK